MFQRTTNRIKLFRKRSVFYKCIPRPQESYRNIFNDGDIIVTDFPIEFKLNIAGEGAVSISRSCQQLLMLHARL